MPGLHAAWRVYRKCKTFVRTEKELREVCEKEEDFGSRTGNKYIRPEDLLYCRPPGGAGYGNPYVRDVKLVEGDILDEYISPEAARRDYGVVWDEKLEKVDMEATRKLREELRAMRENIYIDQATKPYARVEKRTLTYDDMKMKRR
jgi:hypothetical protein